MWSIIAGQKLEPGFHCQNLSIMFAILPIYTWALSYRESCNQLFNIWAFLHVSRGQGIVRGKWMIQSHRLQPVQKLQKSSFLCLVQSYRFICVLWSVCFAYEALEFHSLRLPTDCYENSVTERVEGLRTWFLRVTNLWESTGTCSLSFLSRERRRIQLVY